MRFGHAQYCLYFCFLHCRCFDFSCLKEDQWDANPVLENADHLVLLCFLDQLHSPFLASHLCIQDVI